VVIIYIFLFFVGDCQTLLCQLSRLLFDIPLNLRKVKVIFLSGAYAVDIRIWFEFIFIVNHK